MARGSPLALTICELNTPRVALLHRWNEIVLDPQSVVAALPHSVRAVFYTDESDQAQSDRSRAVHAAFLHAHPSVRAADFPLLVLSREAITHPASGRSALRHAPRPPMETTRL